MACWWPSAHSSASGCSNASCGGRPLPESGFEAAVAGVIGGLVGAKLLWVFEHIREEPLFDLVLSCGGMSWFGGFAGGILAGLAVMQRKRLPKIAVFAAATPALALGQAIGRIGCFLVGDDYGRPSQLPWSVSARLAADSPGASHAAVRGGGTRPARVAAVSVAPV